jgi:hypothetical protein
MEYNCPRCMLCFGIEPGGMISMAMRNPGPDWGQEPWQLEFLNKHTPKD